MPPSHHFAKCAEDREIKELGGDSGAPVCEKCAQEYQNKGDALYRRHKKGQKNAQSIENKQFDLARAGRGNRKVRGSSSEHRAC
ncbi:MAG TPA: hypothetical protein VFP96_16505 [Candidatus Acidoferrum sp.]|nr:hypothetical protein [Candidatus Acidoferrum sp.]